MTEKIFKSNELDHAIICANCGHINEMHDWDDYTGWRCMEDNCNCSNFRVKVNKNNEVMYKC